MDIGTKIRSIRAEKGLTQQDVASRLNISENTYRKIENSTNSPDINLLEKIAKIYDKTVYDFLPKDNITINQTNQKGSVCYSAYVYNQQLSERVIEQFENRIKEKDDVINVLKETIAILKKQ